MRLPKDYATPRQEETAVEYIWEQKGCVQQRREPIVRCRDCKHFEYCKFHRHSENKSNGFCAWGERKADA